jgi:hypothetical protein
MSYVYRSILNTAENSTRHDVGFYTRNGQWYCESSHAGSGDAAARVSYLNGGIDPDTVRFLVDALHAIAITLERKR